MNFNKDQSGEEFYVFINVSKGSKNFYDKENQTDTLVMMKTIEQPFPGNYGFVPNSFHDDGGTLDAIVLTEEPLEPGIVVKTKAIGVIRLTGKVNDDIIIAVPFDKKINDVSELSMNQLNMITAYFESFKNLKTQKVFDSMHAKKTVQHAIKRYSEEER
ncbi:MAG: inorganic diphosphatase [Nanoarchaeota archaeon]|nr:inorganic diphosphatase [Nanoarchaeota archaeon]